MTDLILFGGEPQPKDVRLGQTGAASVIVVASTAALLLAGAVAITSAIAVSSTRALPLSGAVDLDDPIAYVEGAPERLPLGGTVAIQARVALASSKKLPLSGAVTLSPALPTTSGSGGRRVRAQPPRILEFRLVVPRPVLRDGRLSVLNPVEIIGVFTLPVRPYLLGRLLPAPHAAVLVPQFVVRGTLSLPVLSVRDARLSMTAPTPLDDLFALGLVDVFID